MFQIDFNKPVNVFFCGIGGISMSGLAEILQSRGFKVSGSDMKSSEITERLENKGIRVHIGQRSSNITDDIELFVYTAAIHQDNPEWTEMLAKNIPSLSRADLLGEIMRNFSMPIAVSGTHGKTTTTSMISEILLSGDLDPTISVGGILPSIGGNIRVGKADCFITEACEYTNSFLSFFPKVSVILNVEEDHMDFFKDINDIRNSFKSFAKLLPSDGFLIINGHIDNYREISDSLPCQVYTYGMDSSFDYYPTNVSYDEFGRGSYTLNSPMGSAEIKLGVPGSHNVSNSLAAICCGDICGVDRERIISALLKFNGTARRFQVKGKVGDITIIDDYAHHPTEIEATLNTAKAYKHNKLWVVFQPHTYTRTKAFLNDFAKALSIADGIILSDIYAAREKNTVGIYATDLQRCIIESGHDCQYFPTFDEIENFCLENCSPGDLLITMGAGDIVKVGESLLGM